MKYVGTPRVAPCQDKILFLLRAAGSNGCRPKELASELYRDVTCGGRVHMIVASLRRKGYTIVSQRIITGAGKEVRYILFAA